MQTGAGRPAGSGRPARRRGRTGSRPAGRRRFRRDAPRDRKGGARPPAVAALRSGASADARMLPVLHNSISSAMAPYDGSGAGGAAAISAMGASHARYPFVLDRNGTIVAHGADASLAGGYAAAAAAGGGYAAAAAVRRRDGGRRARRVPWGMGEHGREAPPP